MQLIVKNKHFIDFLKIILILYKNSILQKLYYLAEDVVFINKNKWPFTVQKL